MLSLSEQVAEIEATLSVLAGRLLDASLLDAQPDIVRLDVKHLSDQPIHLVREMFSVLWQRQSWPRGALGYVEWNRLAQTAMQGGSTNLPGGIVARQATAGLLVLQKTDQ